MGRLSLIADIVYLLITYEGIFFVCFYFYVLGDRETRTWVSGIEESLINTPGFYKTVYKVYMFRTGSESKDIDEMVYRTHFA